MMSSLVLQQPGTLQGASVTFAGLPLAKTCHTTKLLRQDFESGWAAGRRVIWSPGPRLRVDKPNKGRRWAPRGVSGKVNLQTQGAERRGTACSPEQVAQSTRCLGWDSGLKWGLGRAADEVTNYSDLPLLQKG